MLKRLFKYRGITALGVIGLGFVLSGCTWAYTTLRATGESAFILHFNDIDAITSVGGIGTIVFAGVFGTIAVLADLLIALELAERDRRLGMALAVGASAFGVLLFIAFAAILKVN